MVVLIRATQCPQADSKIGATRDQITRIPGGGMVYGLLRGHSGVEADVVSSLKTSRWNTLTTEPLRSVNFSKVVRMLQSMI